MPIESLNEISSLTDTIECDGIWKSSPSIAELTPVEAVDTVCNELPSAQDYQEQDRTYVTSYWELQSRKWSEPKYRCPVCEQGGMRRDETVVLTSNPPSYRYQCDACGHIAYHHI